MQTFVISGEINGVSRVVVWREGEGFEDDSGGGLAGTRLDCARLGPQRAGSSPAGSPHSSGGKSGTCQCCSDS